MQNFSKQRGFTPTPERAVLSLHPEQSAPRLVSGFTIIEIVVVMALIVVIVTVFTIFINNITDSSLRLSRSLVRQQQIQQTLQVMVPEIRSASQSNTGAYPIIEAASSSLTFYSDINGNGLIDRVRYYLDGDVFKKSVIEPSGEPLSYDPDDEIVFDLVENIISGINLFDYYDENATSTQSDPLSFPINIVNVRMVKATIVANQGTPSLPSIVGVSDQVTIRNLRYK